MGWKRRSPLGTGLNSSVYDLVVIGDDLIVAGGFSATIGMPPPDPRGAPIGVIELPGIGKWNGTEWSRMGSKFTGGGVLVTAGTNLYAHGSFEWSPNAGCVAQWDGNRWWPLGMGLDGGVNALAESGTNLYVGGRFQGAGGKAVNGIARWDGVQWSSLRDGLTDVSSSSVLQCIGSVRCHCLRRGLLFRSRWGTGPKYCPMGRYGVVRVGCRGEQWGECARVVRNKSLRRRPIHDCGRSYLQRCCPVGRNNLARPWRRAHGGRDIVAALAVSGTNLYAGGDFTTAEGITVNYIAKWNGSQWLTLGSGMNFFVNALAVSGKDLYVGGIFTAAGGISANRVARWDGSEWHPIGSGFEDGWRLLEVLSIAAVGSDIYIGGEFYDPNSSSVYRLAKWNGDQWLLLGSGLNGPVTAMANTGGDFYFGGIFTTVGGMASTCVARVLLNGMPLIHLAPPSVSSGQVMFTVSGVQTKRITSRGRRHRPAHGRSSEPLRSQTTKWGSSRSQSSTRRGVLPCRATVKDG